MKKAVDYIVRNRQKARRQENGRLSLSILTYPTPSDVLQKNLAKETKAGSEVNVEMASGCRDMRNIYINP